MSASKRAAFTLVELLVVISIIGVLMGLALPAVQSARESARKTNCTNNEKNLGMAALQFHNTYKRFPGYVNATGATATASNGFHPVSWAVMLLPYIGRNDLWTQWSKFDVATASISTTTHPESYIELLICPSNPPPVKNTSPWSYAVNGGYVGDVSTSGVLTENGFNGVFFNHFSKDGGTTKGFDPNTMPAMSLSYLAATTSDGASTTMMLTENMRQQTDVATQGWRTLYPTTTAGNRLARTERAVIWHLDDLVQTRRINNQTTSPTPATEDWARPSSYHPQGVVVVFCDGHTRFVNQNVSYDIYRQLMTSAGRSALGNYVQYTDNF